MFATRVRSRKRTLLRRLQFASMT